LGVVEVVHLPNDGEQVHQVVLKVAEVDDDRLSGPGDCEPLSTQHALCHHDAQIAP
jgi:hypothetical protein